MKSGRKTFIRTEIFLGILVLISIGFIIYNRTLDRTERIAVIVPDIDGGQRTAFQYGLKAAAQEFDVNIVLINKENLETMDDEVEAVAKEIEKGVDGIILQPITNSGEESRIKQVIGKVPIMIVGDSFVKDGSSIFQTIEPDHYQMGVDLAKKLLEDYNGNLSGKTIGIYSQKSDSTALCKREEGVIDTLKESGAEILWSVSKEDASKEVVNLQTQRKVNIVIALDNDSLVEAGESAVQNDLYGALIYGIGNSAEAIYYLDSRWVECVIVPDEFDAGNQSVAELVRRLRKRYYTMQNHEVAYTVLTRENLFLKENQNLLFTISQ